ncbi:MAG TPA: BatD family protein [Paludibacteraceae bacterium]|nr:BatD family protein [Paludibacteraceae bacterium]HPS09743.1 BatD family protein [Paludibacteraceae bacterium]
MKRILIFFTSVLLTLTALSAQDKVSFTASAPATVYMDTPFQLVYSVNASAKDLRAPDFQFFEILAGPFESHSSSYQNINGKATSSVNVSYTFTLLPNKVGTFKIPGAAIEVDDEKYVSNAMTIKVLPADKTQSQGQGGAGSPATGAETQRISNDNIFIRTSVSKTNVYEQEAILVTYKLYTLLDVAQFTEMKFPDFNGFLKQEIAQPKNAQLSYENYNGKNFGTVVLYQVLLFPQRTGEINIDKANFTAILRIQNKAQVRSIFDDFFDSYSNVQKSLTAPGARITVNALPAGKPASFTGAVGNFSLSSSISKTNLKANDAGIIKVVISGTGNMKLLQNPEIKFPEGFEVYDPKADNKFSTNANGVSGTKTIEYMFIPQHAGVFNIPSAELSYFDLNDRTYKTLRTPAYRLNVAKGVGGENTIVGNYTNKEDVTQMAKDIRYIHTGKIKLHAEETPLFGSMLFWMMFLIPLLVAGILFIYFRKQIRENADISLMKTKKANKVAQKRLKLAQKFLTEGKKSQFYEEVMKAVWTYLSDKLSIPVAALNKENIAAEMTERGIDNELTNQFTNILNTCEYASYAPNSGQQEMGNLYEETIEAIGKVEEYFKKK